MARRRQKEDPVMNLVIFVILVTSAAAWFFTESLIIAILVFIGLVVLVAFFQSMQRQAYRERLRRSGIADIDQMDGRQFEHYLSVLFDALGYKAEVTKAAGDFGADLILRKERKTIVVQAKRYKSNIGIKAVQEVQAAIAHYKAQEAWVVTNQNFTAQATTLAQSNQVRLIGRQTLIDLILQVNPEQAPNPRAIINEVPYQPRKCSCGAEMVIRRGKRGEFWGCSRFPECRNLLDLTH